MVKTKSVTITEKTAIVNINSPKALAAFAKELKAFVVANELYTGIESKRKIDDEWVTVVKNYVHVEGWQFAGASMGIFPRVVSDQDLSPIDKFIEYQDKYKKTVKTPVYKYKSTVELVQISSGNVIGTGIALCSNEETKKRSFDEYAVLSMAQTRATGKAFRMTLGWIMKLAGYEATPAEEITKELVEVEVETEDDAASSTIPMDDLKVLVNIALQKMAVTDKVKFMKDYAGTISEKALDDTRYRRLYNELQSRKEKAAQESQDN